MILTTHLLADAALRALLERTQGAPSSAASGQRHAQARRDAPGNSTTVACDNEEAVDDLTALREGTLDDDGIDRLTKHIKRCESCQLLLVYIIEQAQVAQGTDVVHAIDPATEVEDGHRPRQHLKAET
jgi:hypothetical protein